eukprot:GHVU01165490.1.p1 GENE.GHVU01165490.1~~GHVU01165490.1.p1  ORF type:complete len:495 (+),score=68.54 GHVU01165490.1:193-1677(+)
MSKSTKSGSKVLDVYVKLPSGRTTSVTLSPTDTIQTVCEHVATEEGVPANLVVLKYTGKVLKKDKTLGYLGVCQETILKAEVISVKDVCIYIKKSSGETKQVTLKNVSTVTDLKSKIADDCDIPTHKQKIKHSNVTLTDGKQTLLEVGLSNEGVINLEELPDRAPETAAAAEPDKPDLDDDQKDAILNSFNTEGRNVEVVFSFDTTGSMYSCLTQVRTKLRETIDRLLRDIPNIRIGIIAQGDYCDYGNYVVKIKDLTNNVDELVKFVDDVPQTGGGDSPEAYEWVLHMTRNMDWSEDSAKALVVIGDDVPHVRSYTDQHINWHDELDMLVALGIKVYGVQAHGSQTSADFYKELADRSGGAYIQFSNFSIIQDMFFAVCYNESAPEQFEAFSEELEGEGRMTEEVKAVIDQIQEASKQPQPQQASGRYQAVAWWDPSLDVTTSPSYSYDAQTDQWKPTTSAHSRQPVIFSSDISSTTASKIKSRRKTSKCTIM